MNFISCFLIIAIVTLGIVEAIFGQDTDQISSIKLMAGNNDWGYRSGNFLNPSQWKNAYKSCGGYRQTGIDIDTKTVQYWPSLKEPSISFSGKVSDVTLKKGSLTIYLNFADGWRISFGGAECYKPVQIHWHWGSKDNQGSEHSRDKVTYPIEGHIVTYDCNLYNTFDEASKLPGGLHAFGIMYQIGDGNDALATLTKHFGKINSGGSINIPEIPPRMFMPNNISKYFRYEGSLTTPPCTENVIWTVFNEFQTISRAQLQLFRSLTYGSPESGPMVDNYRPIGQIKASSDYVKRVIYASFNRGNGNESRAIIVSLTTLLAAIIQTL